MADAPAEPAPPQPAARSPRSSSGPLAPTLVAALSIRAPTAAADDAGGKPAGRRTPRGGRRRSTGGGDGPTVADALSMLEEQNAPPTSTSPKGRRRPTPPPPPPPPQQADDGSADELVVLKDLDTGKEVRVEKRYTIRDLTTGQLFLLESADLPTSDGECGSGGPGSVAGGGGGPRVTDLASGKAFTLADFDRVLGLHSGLEAVRRGRASTAAEAGCDSGSGASGGALPSVGGALPPAGSGAGAWVRRALARARGLGGGGQAARRRRATSTAGGEPSPARAAPPARPHPPHLLAAAVGAAAARPHAKPAGLESATTSASTTVADEPEGAPAAQARPHHHHRASLDSPASSASTLGGGGSATPAASAAAPLAPGALIPVTVHRAAHRSLSRLTLVQALPVHDGPVWAAAFSPDGGFLATAGADAVVKVWEVVPGRAAAADAAADADAAAAAAAAEAAAAAAGASRGSTPAVEEDGGAAALPAPPAPAPLPPPPPPPPPLLKPSPLRAWSGHRSDVLALAWSRSGFLLSASMDKAVRLWHATADPCLRVFRHSDFVTSLSFHPADDRLFASGSIDGRARLWSIPEGRVAAAADVRDMVTAAAFAPDGSALALGTMKGRVHVRSLAGSLDGGGGGSEEGGGGESAASSPGGPHSRLALEHEAVLDVRNRRGGDAGGRKVTGIAFAPPSAGGGSGPAAGGPHPTPSTAAASPTASARRRRMLVTTNDSRVRLYDGCIQAAKFKGHANRHTQLRAVWEEGGRRVLCGSDDGRVVVWAVPPRHTATSPTPASPGASSPPSASSVIPPRAKVGAYEAFQASAEGVTVALFGPGGSAATRPALPASALASGRPAGGAAGALARAVAAAGGTGGQAGAALAARVGAARAWARSAGGADEGAAAGAAALVAAGGAAAAAAALAAADAAMAAAAAGPGPGTLIVAAGYGGELRVFESAGVPEWI